MGGGSRWELEPHPADGGSTPSQVRMGGGGYPIPGPGGKEGTPSS